MARSSQSHSYLHRGLGAALLAALMAFAVLLCPLRTVAQETDYPALAREVAGELGSAAEKLAGSLSTEDKRAFAGRMRAIASDISMTAGVKGGSVVFAIEDALSSTVPPTAAVLDRIKQNAAAGAVGMARAVNALGREQAFAAAGEGQLQFRLAQILQAKSYMLNKVQDYGYPLDAAQAAQLRRDGEKMRELDNALAPLIGGITSFADTIFPEIDFMQCPEGSVLAVDVTNPMEQSLPRQECRKLPSESPVLDYVRANPAVIGSAVAALVFALGVLFVFLRLTRRAPHKDG